jgi:hypothetical protein
VALCVEKGGPVALFALWLGPPVRTCLNCRALARSAAPVGYLVGQLTHGLREGLEPFIFSAMPFIVQGHFVLDEDYSAHIAADSTARNLSHALSVAPRHSRVNAAAPGTSHSLDIITQLRTTLEQCPPRRDSADRSAPDAAVEAGMLQSRNACGPEEVGRRSLLVVALLILDRKSWRTAPESAIDRVPRRIS